MEMRPLIHRLLILVANGRIDEDCSGADAQGIDGDGDGFLDTEDCNDGDSSINPDAAEACDGIDNNCDGQTDEGVTTTFYVDGDGDGFGSTPTEACSISSSLSVPMEIMMIQMHKQDQIWLS